MPDTTLELQANPAPGPGARWGRAAGQTGGVFAFVDLWQAFGWFGSDTWTADEAARRWPAIFGAAVIVTAGVHNLVNWWRTERSRPVHSVEVTARQDTP